jgi:peptidylprolyl isomerase
MRRHRLLGLAATAVLAAAAGPATSGAAPSGPATASAARAFAFPSVSRDLARKPRIGRTHGAAPRKLKVKDVVVGTGATAKAGSTVTTQYVGVLYRGGHEFDASWGRGQPFAFLLGSGMVIRGWDRGIAGMKVGGRRILVVPARLAYGAAGSPPAIPANATLVFVVDLKQVQG